MISRKKVNYIHEVIMKFVCYTVKSVIFVCTQLSLSDRLWRDKKVNLYDHRTKYLNRTLNVTQTGLVNWQTWIYQRFLY